MPTMRTKFKLTEQNYRYMFDNASDAIWVHDMEGRILTANKACGKLTGYTRQELIGINVTRFLTPEFLNTATEVKRKLLEGEEFEQPHEQKLVRKDGTTRILKVAASLVIINGEVAGIQHVARDVTREKNLEESMHFYVQQITRAQENERKRIAMELHDEASPPLLLLIQRLDAIASSPSPKKSNSVRDDLEGLRNQAVNALEGIRRSAQNLRPRILDDLGLIPALEWMTEDLLKNYEIDAHFEVKGTIKNLTDEIQLVLFRIAQEELANVRRHSEASRVLVMLEFGDNRVFLTVLDNGKGFELPEEIADLASIGKLGLTGIQERARLLGGSLKIQSERGKGTQLVVEVPLRE